MNPCDEIKTRLADYAVGALEDRERAELERHVAGCAACRRELRALQRTGALVGLLPQEEPPAGLWEAVWREIEAPARERTRVPGWRVFPWPRLAAAAVAAAVIVAAVVVFRPQQPPAVTGTADGADYIERHEMLAWNDPLSDKAARGLMLGFTAAPPETP